jgi:hypothetical protein
MTTTGIFRSSCRSKAAEEKHGCRSSKTAENKQHFANEINMVSSVFITLIGKYDIVK